MPSQFDREKTRKKIALILERIKTEADPRLLNEYRSLFKEEISLFRRSWAAAYLLMRFDQEGDGGPEIRYSSIPSEGQGAGGRTDKNRGRKKGDSRSRPPEGNSEKSGDAGNEAQRYPLAEEESKRLFISVGRNRRVFPREILGLINTRTAIPREDIGAIRILDNYSFVQVRDTIADTIIEALNGQIFRGRTLTVNYAKSRRDGNSDEDGREAPQPEDWQQYGPGEDSGPSEQDQD